MILSACFLGGAAAQAVGPYAAVDEANRIHYGDVVDIDIVGSLEFDWRGGITPEGFLDGYDRIAELIYALCRTEEEVGDSLALELSKILREPVVKVRIIDRTKRPVGFLAGAVRTPQRFQIRREIYLRELLILTGGIADNANGGIQIFRPPGASCLPASGSANDGGTRGDVGSTGTISISISDILAGMPEANPRILTGDIITVLKTLPVYVVGGVRNPGQVAFRENLTLSRAVAAAGGIAKGAAEDRVVVYRRDGVNSPMFEVDFAKISEGTAEDVPLRAFDIIEIREKGRGARRPPPRIGAPPDDAEASSRLPLRIID